MPLQGSDPYPYLGFDVLSWIPDGVLNRSGKWETALQRLDVPSGAFSIAAPEVHAQHSVQAVYRCFTRADRAALWTWMTGKLGRFTPFWCPTFQRDLEILTAGSSNTWVVRYAGYSAMLAADPYANHLFASISPGSPPVVCRVQGAVDNGDGTETIDYNNADVAGPSVLPFVAPTLNGATFASILRLSRFASDALKQTFYTPSIIDIGLDVVSIVGEQSVPVFTVPLAGVTSTDFLATDFH